MTTPNEPVSNAYKLAKDRCTTHHHACGCREAKHAEEVASKERTIRAVVEAAKQAEGEFRARLAKTEETNRGLVSLLMYTEQQLQALKADRDALLAEVKARRAFDDARDILGRVEDSSVRDRHESAIVATNSIPALAAELEKP